MEMESHCVQRRGTSIWTLHEKCVIKPLTAAKMIREEDADLIQRYCGILDVNTFEVRTESFEVCIFFNRVIAKSSTTVTKRNWSSF